jgi:cytochrome c oxidase subunit 2
MGARIPLVLGVLAAVATFAALTLADERTGPAEPAGAGRTVFARLGCGGCHQLAAAHATGSIGPNLDARLRGYDRASLVAKIVDPYPNAPAADFASMPEDFGARMTQGELEALVTFLLAAR